MKTTITIERYELKISSLIKKIQEIEGTLWKRTVTMDSKKNDPQKLEKAIMKLKEARKILYDAIGLLVESANPYTNSKSN